MTTPHEQMMREALRLALDALIKAGTTDEDDYRRQGDAIHACQQALTATVKESLTPEPAPMVRLTTADIQALRDTYAEKHMTFMRIHRGQCVCMPEDLEGFALEVQAAVIAKNGGGKP